MHDGACPTTGPNRVFIRFWQCAAGFWRDPTTGVARGLIAILVVAPILELLVQYRLNVWTRDFFDALERKDGTMIGRQVLVFAPLAVAGVAVAITGVWSRMKAQRQWREWLSRQLIDRWLSNGGYRQMVLRLDGDLNPEYRIAEDARVATDAPIDLGIGLLSSLLTVLTFIGVLWSVGGDFDARRLGHDIVIPGYLVLGAVAYAAFTTAGMLVIGRRMVQVFEGKNNAEAELRHSATRLRENALLDDNSINRDALWSALELVIARWRDLAWQLMQTTLIARGSLLLSPVVALAFCAPKYLAGTMTLGEVTQASAAFVIVQAAFSWLVDNYPRLAEWASSANRVGSLLVTLDGITPSLPPSGVASGPDSGKEAGAPHG
ncbi:SbmA/BacA-like family transporter [Ferrovibrio xuzhouensis]|uniref:SbmA/BacA-like family transporter n=1 Tax=Ferrovibrio xuzhouensis TaxID=1576914 RepID=A0ABV7VH03_9PROT